MKQNDKRYGFREKQYNREQITNIFKDDFLQSLFYAKCQDNNETSSIETAQIFFSDFKKRNNLEEYEYYKSNPNKTRRTSTLNSTSAL
jgi:hypothetical protein